MLLRLIGYGPLVGLSLLVASAALAEGAPAGDVVAPAVAAPEAPASEAAPAVTDAGPKADTAPGATMPDAKEPAPVDAPDADAPAATEPAPADETAEPPVTEEALVDPATFLQDAYTTCISALENPEGAYDIFDAAEWMPEADTSSETAYYRQIDGSKSVPGIGEATLFHSIEVFPSLSINYCLISLDTTDATIPIANLLDNRELRGSVRREGDRVFSIWERDADYPDLFMQVDQNDETGSFVLDVTMNSETPATDLPPLTSSDWESE